jgi:1,4-alpha-glucan branching enzyme
MKPFVDDSGCPAFATVCHFPADQVGHDFSWGVRLQRADQPDQWGVATEVKDTLAREQRLTFRLRPSEGIPQEETYRLTHLGWLGANVVRRPLGRKGIRFALWAPRAQAVEVVFGDPQHGYIADDGTGVVSSLPPVPLTRNEQGVWQADLVDVQGRYLFQPYMFRLRNAQGATVYRTDLYSRCQIGSGALDPQGAPYGGDRQSLAGSKSCSVVCDARQIKRQFAEARWPPTDLVDEQEFWRDEYRAERPVPRRVQDLVIYELHVGSLGFGRAETGTLGDALDFLDHLISLGINAVELLPLSEHKGTMDWGYSTSHYLAVEYSSGGRDQLKHFVRACHQRGLAVIMDVVYNHYHHQAERAQWAYDSSRPEENLYYWYEGQPGDYAEYERAVREAQAQGRAEPVAGHGGYLDNLSTGYAPRFHEEMVRKLFISSALALVEEFHIDGFRVDQTTSIHAYNVRHADGRPVGAANSFGAKFLREFSRSLRLVRPEVMLMAEDHSHWDMVTAEPDQGGLGFHAIWNSDFYHNLVGSRPRLGDKACLITRAGSGGDQPLPMDQFAAVLAATSPRMVVYHESHDEAGNAAFSGRTMTLAINGADMTPERRRYAAARSRFAAGMALLSAATPLIFMGEEVGTTTPFKHAGFARNKVDLYGERQTGGAQHFKFYQDLIGLRLDPQRPALRQAAVQVVHCDNASRLIAFRRQQSGEEYLVVGTLSNWPFAEGYRLPLGRAAGERWRELFNSDSHFYGGANAGNAGTVGAAEDGSLVVRLPANGFVVLQRED